MSLPDLNIVEAMDSTRVWRRWFKKPATWAPWRSFLKVLFGLPLDEADLAVYRECTGRSAPPPGGFLEAWLVVGRKGGKSFILALIACFLACFRDWSPFLAPGERGMVTVIAADRKQARTIFRYCRALLVEVPALARLVERADGEAIDLSNGISIEIMTASFRSVRGYTIIAALCDEIAFWRTEETAANPDAEILDALRPAMTTVEGAMLLCASSPYAKRGALFETYRDHFGEDDAEPLVWQAPTLTMHPNVRRSVIDKAYARDAAHAAAEYGAEFRADIETFVSREVIEAAVAPGRRELPVMRGAHYFAFEDPSGASGGDSMTLCIGYRDKEGRVIQAAAREARPPFSPDGVVQEFAALLKSYRIHKVVGDHYAGEWPRERHRAHGIGYEVAKQVTSDLYRDLLPVLNSGQIELLDLPRQTAQLCNLERRTARSGKDSIGHPDKQHDDLANALAGMVTLAVGKRRPMKISAAALANSANKNYRPKPRPASPAASGAGWSVARAVALRQLILAANGKIG